MPEGEAHLMPHVAFILEHDGKAMLGLFLEIP